jgi:hypothetical protein
VYLREVHEVLEAGVEMSLLPQGAHVLEVRVVHVRVHAEQPLEDGAHHLLEVVWEGSPVLLREDLGIVQLHSKP